ncbi:MAG: RHS repeat-associated core domain-containing protein [Planctomycetota bacterium]|nr:MAG: RHS repeat-associated core domain-containing protein [Planctomycetota bacterium]
MTVSGASPSVVYGYEVGDPNHIDYFYNQGWQLLEERIASTADVPEEVKQYVWSLSYIDAPIVQFHDTDASGTYDAERYYTFDANQNITAVLDGANGNVLERYVYDPYGAVTVYDSAWANPTAPSDDGPLYAGYYFDAETGLYHVRNRYYDAALGRFIARDPIGYGDGMNLYQYVGGRPLDGIDPSGLQRQDADIEDPRFELVEFSVWDYEWLIPGDTDQLVAILVWGYSWTCDEEGKILVRHAFEIERHATQGGTVEIDMRVEEVLNDPHRASILMVGAATWKEASVAGAAIGSMIGGWGGAKAGARIGKQFPETMQRASVPGGAIIGGVGGFIGGAWKGSKEFGEQVEAHFRRIVEIACVCNGEGVWYPDPAGSEIVHEDYTDVHDATGDLYFKPHKLGMSVPKAVVKKSLDIPV